MGDLLFLYFVEIVFIAFAVFAPVLARYCGWASRMGSKPWTRDKEADMTAAFRLMSGLGALLVLYLCISQTVRALN